MSKYKSLFNDARLFTILVIICVGFLGVSTWSSGFSTKQSKQVNLEDIRRDFDIKDLKVKNLTKALSIVEVSKTESGQIRVLFRNEYDKKITGYNVSVGSGRIQTELILSGNDSNFILPGDTREEFYAIQEDLAKQGLTVLAVVFEDGTNDGDSKFAKEIKQYRQGIIIERERVLSDLESISKLPDSDVPAALNQLQAKILALSDEQDKSLSINVRFGIKDEKRRIIRELHDIKNGRQLLKEQNSNTEETALEGRKLLTNLVGYYKNLIAKAKF